MHRLRRFALVSVWLTLTELAQALVVLPADLDELARRARVIVHGTITGLRPQLAPDRRQIDTLVSIEAISYLKGDFGPELTFRVPGGELGRYRTIVPGAPAFAPGDEVVLFLSASGPTIPYVVGLNQGVFRVVQAAGADERLVLPGVASPDPPRRVVRGDPANRPVPLSQFLASLRQQVEGR